MLGNPHDVEENVFAAFAPGIDRFSRGAVLAHMA
jgi:hypothetical protein